MTTVEFIILGVAALLVLTRVISTPIFGRHSLLYHFYVVRNSHLWRTRKFIWYWTSSRRCTRCGRRVRLHAMNPARRATFHHKTYRHLLFERRGRDVELLCWSCHGRADSWRHRL